jgi:peptidoglycan/xylan/chitin deacetylase (PgdA/CDA1 family)
MEALEKAGTKFLLYHDLLELADGDPGLARERFRRQLSLMAGWGFSFRSMREFVAGKALGDRDIVITFDDGGRSFMDCALPVLEEFSASATMYTVADFVGQTGRMDFLTWDDLDEIVARGTDIGSHGLNHMPLTGSNADEIRREIFGAAEVFERHGHAPSTFAYPYGRRSDTAKEVVREAGFKAAFTIKQGGRDPFELRRRLFTLGEPAPLVRFFLSDHYFEVRGAIVGIVPGRLRREWRPLPQSVIGGRSFGLDEWEPPESVS